MDKRTRVITSVCAVTTAALAASVVYAVNGSSQPGDPAAARLQLAAALNAHPPQSMWSPANLVDILPNMRHAWSTPPGQPGQPVSDSVVRGRIADVAEYSGFIESGQAPTAGRPGASLTAYDDPKAHWRAVRVTVEVVETLAGPPSKELQIYLSMIGHAESDDEVSTMEQTMQGLGEVVVITNRVPSGPEYLGMTRDLADKSFGMAAVDESGNLTFSLADPDGPSPQEFMAGVDTLEELRAELSKAPRTKVHEG